MRISMLQIIIYHHNYKTKTKYGWMDSQICIKILHYIIVNKTVGLGYHGTNKFICMYMVHGYKDIDTYSHVFI